MTDSADAEKKKIVIVEDHPIFRSMLVHLVKKELGMTVAGEADNIKDAITIIKETRPDVAIVDITLRGSSGLELIKDMKKQAIPTPVIVISMHEAGLYAERVLRAGARGYISKSEPIAEVIAAILKVMNGGIYLGAKMTEAVLERLARAESPTEPSGIEALADRELEVFNLLGRGLNSRQISEQINLGVSTVESYRQRIKEKLGLKNAAAVYQRAAQWVFERNV